MRKYPIIIPILALLLSFVTKASENEFWDVLAELEERMLISEQTSLSLINKLEGEVKKTKTNKLMQSALFNAKLDFLELYGSKQEFKAHIEKNISKINKSHIDYNVYLSKLAILYFEFGEHSKYQDVISQIELNEGQIFAAVVQLTTSASETNFQLVNTFCHDCNFYLYHNAIANYYSELGLYFLLEKFVQETLSKNYIVDGREDIRSRIFIAYLYVSNKCQNLDNEHLDDIYLGSISGVEHIKGLSNKVKSVLDSGCK